MHAYIYKHTCYPYKCIHTYVYIQASMYMHKNTCAYMYIHIHILAYTYIYKHMETHTCAHIHIYSCILCIYMRKDNIASSKH